MLLSKKESFNRIGALLLVAVLVTGCIGLGLLKGNSAIAVVPILAVFGLAVVMDYRIAYYLLLASIPFSVNQQFGGSLTLDFPSEPLMLVLVACFGLTLFLTRSSSLSFYLHPIWILLMLSLGWAIISSVTSVDLVKSVKYLLAKIWFLIPFVLVTAGIVKSPADVKRMTLFFVVPLCLIVGYVMVRHAGYFFSFEGVNPALKPFFVNHVIYAATLALALPFTIWAAWESRKKTGQLLFFAGCTLVLLTGIGFSYTRASWLAVVAAVAYLVVLKLDLTRWVLIAFGLGVTATAAFFIYENTYQQYAPNFEKTIFYGQNFEKHLEATVNFEDVSGMERVYRWIAAVKIFAEHPITGIGPSTFYPEYKKYTVRSFETYVSDNPERSTTHNYFLLMLSEQGLPGFLLFAALWVYVLLRGQRLYREMIDNRLKALLIATLCSLVIMAVHLALNELIEVDKTGSWFYISLALFIKLDLWHRATRPDLFEPAG
jgi:O-antigen ligase